MSVMITDCTIRDGGYLLNKNSTPEFVKGVIAGLTKAGIDFIETGFLQNSVNGESIVYHNSKDIIKYLPENGGKSNYLGFCDNSRYSIENLHDYDGTSFKWMRISFAKHEIDSALEFCKQIMEKGYWVQFNPMDSISYSFEEREELVKKVNNVKPAAFSIVDTFGAMYLDDLTAIFKQVDSLLDKEIKIGLHSHDNLGLSCALAEHMITLANESGRDIIIDGSLFGMGRGAGNASTELLADYLNKKCGADYNISVLLEKIDKYISPLRTNIHWGYDLPMYVCGTLHSHVDNVYYLQEKCNCDILLFPMSSTDVVPIEQFKYVYNKDYIKVARFSSYEFRELRGIIANAKYCITMKHHPIVFAMGECIPTSSIAYKPYYVYKNKGALAIFDMDKYCLDLESSDYHVQFTDLFDEVIVNEDKIVDKLKNAINTMPSRRERLLEIVDEILK